MSRQYPHSKQGGFNLLGFTLTALLVLLVVIGTVAAYQDNSDRVASMDVRKNLMSIRAGIVSKLGPVGNFGDLDTSGSQLLIDLDVVPRSLVQGSTVRNEYGGFYTFGSSNGGVTGAPDDAYATITTSDVPLDVCLSIGSGDTDQWQQVQVNSAVVDGSLATAQTNCTAGETNDVTFAFRR